MNYSIGHQDYELHFLRCEHVEALVYADKSYTTDRIEISLYMRTFIKLSRCEHMSKNIFQF